MMSAFATVKEESYQQMKQCMYRGCMYMIPNTTTLKVCMLYLMYVVIHYLTPYIYIQLCVPRTMIGFFLSPMMVPTPHCKAIRWVFSYTSTSIDGMWIMLGAWLIGQIHALVVYVGTKTKVNVVVNVVEEEEVSATA